MLRVMPPTQHYMFCRRLHSISCIPPTKAPSRSTIPEPTRPNRAPPSQCSPPTVFSQNLHPRALRLRVPPSLASERPQTSAPNQPAGAFFRRQDPLRSTPSSLPSSPFGVSGAGLQMPKMVVDYSGGYTSGGAEEELRGRDAMKIHMKNKRSGFWGMDMRARRVIMDRLEWCGTPDGRLVSRSAPWSRWSERRESNAPFRRLP